MVDSDARLLSEADRHELVKRIFIEALAAVVQTLVDTVGSEAALRALDHRMMNSGSAFSINMIDMFEIEGSDLERIARTTDLAADLYDMGNQEILRTDDRIVRIGGPNCPYRSCPREQCIMGHQFFLTAICKQINPEYHCRLTQMIHDGDPICQIVIEKDVRKEPAPEHPDLE